MPGKGASILKLLQSDSKPREHARDLEMSGTGWAGAGIRRPGHRAVPAARPSARPAVRPAGAAYHLERDAELSFAPPARGHAARRPDGRPPGPAPAAGSTGGQHPPCSRRRAGEPRTPAAPPDRMLTHSPIHRIISLDREGHNNGRSPGSTTTHPPKKGGGVKKKKKKRQGFLTLFFFFHPPTQHSIKRTKTDILFADLANIKAISIVHRSSPKLVKVVACGSPAKLSFNSYRMPRHSETEEGKLAKFR